MASGIKKITALLAVTAAFCCCTATVWAEKDSANRDVIYSKQKDGNIYISEDKFLYNFTGENPGVTICGYAGEETELTLPFMINGREVSAIDNGTFQNDPRIVSVTLPYSIKAIGENSFCGCTSLKSVSLSSGVSNFSNVFCDCPLLTDISFPSGVTSILESFRRCQALSHVKFARSVTQIDQHSFSDCVSLKKIEWLGGITKLNDAFDGCTALESVTLPHGMVLINGAFDGCDSLSKIDFPDTLLYITGGFSDCPALKSVEFPEKLLFINESFNNCKNLSKIKTNEVTNISDTAFRNCPKLLMKKDNNLIWRILGWTALFVLMALTGILVFRKLTAIAEGYSRPRKASGAKQS